MLTKDQKKSRLDISKYLLSLYEDDPEEFMYRVVTQDKTWGHHFHSEAKKQSMQWNHPGSPPPKNVREFLQQVMACIFWDSQGVIMVGYLEGGCMTNGT